MILLSLIKKAAVEAVDAGSPCAVLFGIVQTASPLTVSAGDSQRPLTLTERQLTTTETVRGLVPGDSVLLLRAQGGSRYIIIDKLSSR